MLFNYYLYSIVSGIIILIIMLINKKYIDKENKYINFIIPIIVSLLVLIICYIIEQQVNLIIPSFNALNQQILTEPF